MPDISRRQFLGGAVALGGVAALGGWRWAARDDESSGTRATAARKPTATDRTLVVVTLYGGNDALNTVVPIGDPQYAALRRQLAVDPAKVHDLTEGFALHPALGGCKELWDSDRLAIVHGVGFADLDRSHFHCMDVWQAGTEDDQRSGWIGRWLDKEGDDPLDAVHVGRDLPLLLRGEKRTAAVVPAGGFALPGNARLRSQLERLSAVEDRRPALAKDVASSSRDLLDVVDQVRPLVSDDRADEFEGESLGARLQTVATLIEADLPTRVYSVELGGFDTHAAEAATHDSLLHELDDALHAFVQRMDDREVTVAVYSEFGRRVAPNASAGTDHGRAGVVLVAGNVKPGHHGDPPSLSALDDGDLATTTDYRAVLGGLAEEILGIQAPDLFGKGPKPLSLV